jgi:hypothetical protein
VNPEKRADLGFSSKAVYDPPYAATQSINAPIYMLSSFQYGAEICERVVDRDWKEANIYGRFRLEFSTDD